MWTPSPCILCCGFPTGFTAPAAELFLNFEAKGSSKEALGPPDTKKAKPRQEDQEGRGGLHEAPPALLCKAGPEAPLLPAPHSLGSPGRRAASLYSPWTARPSAAPHTLHTDRQTDSGGSEPPPGMAALLQGCREADSLNFQETR